MSKEPFTTCPSAYADGKRLSLKFYLYIVNLLKNSYCRISFLLINKIKTINILFNDIKLTLPRFSSKV
ncbi:hypothetical protein EYY58_14895 [Acinetobacter bereziniae]|nr:hypothetical protein NDM229_009745 [Acinetobacter bereziniae]TNL46469.1 hypothetical protein EYB59_17205 [Acinetobacter bereziniae]TNL56579.1 hypothetical protein EYY58_14895 [Acinetobacter bereziniae]